MIVVKRKNHKGVTNGDFTNKNRKGSNMSKDATPTPSQLRWSMNRKKTLYTWGTHGSHKRTSTKNNMSDGIPIQIDDAGIIQKIPSEQSIVLWVKEYFQTGDSPTVKYRWSMNRKRTYYFWGVPGSDKRTSTQNKFSKGIRAEYNENGTRKKIPSIAAINKWEAEYFRRGEGEALVKLTEIALQFSDIKLDTRSCHERHVSSLIAWLEVKHPHVKLIKDVTVLQSQQYVQFIKNNPLITTQNKVSRLTVDFHCQSLRFLFELAAPLIKLEGELPFHNYKALVAKRIDENDTIDKFFTEEEALWIIKNLRLREIELGSFWKKTHPNAPDRPRAGNLYHTSMLQWYMGCRISDACLLQTSTINLNTRIIKYTPFKTAKYGIVAEIYIVDELFDYLSNLESIKKRETFVSSGDALRYLGCETEEKVLNRIDLDHADNKLGTTGSSQRYNKEFGNFLEKLLLPGQTDEYFKPRGEKREGMANRPSLLNTHCFRHGFGFLMAVKGVPTIGIKKAMGHSSVKMTDKYMNHVNDELTRRMFTGEVSAPIISPTQVGNAAKSDQAAMLKLLESLDGVSSMREMFDKIDEAKRKLG